MPHAPPEMRGSAAYCEGTPSLTVTVGTLGTGVIAADAAGGFGAAVALGSSVRWASHPTISSPTVKVITGAILVIFRIRSVIGPPDIPGDDDRPGGQRAFPCRPN
jgi:hypothetical protein